MAIYSRYKAEFGKEVEALPVPIQNTDNPYTDEAAMHADQSNQLEGYGYLVTGVGAFIYLGTLAGTAEDYEAFMPTKDIILKSDNTSSTLYFYDNLTYDTQYAFIRYNASNNNLEFGSKDGSIQDEVISAIIDRGKTDWQFKDTIQINNPGKGVWMHSPDNTSYQIRTNDGGVLELWTTDGAGNLETLVWSSANGASAQTLTGTSLDLSNVVGNNYNYAAFSSATTYTTTTPVINGFARCFINAASEPTVTGATKVGLMSFEPNVNMEMVINSPDGVVVEFEFLAR